MAKLARQAFAVVTKHTLIEIRTSNFTRILLQKKSCRFGFRAVFEWITPSKISSGLGLSLTKALPLKSCFEPQST